ncbi:hypothetical protein ACFWBX_31005 [Streptomyces sp. NPDC059991]
MRLTTLLARSGRLVLQGLGGPSHPVAARCEGALVAAAATATRTWVL